MIVCLCFFCCDRGNAADNLPVSVSDSFTIVNIYPHDSTAFTQGLCFVDGLLYEGTGLYGQSSLRRGSLSGKNQVVKHLSADLFGEGITIWHERIIQLIWKSGVRLIWNKKNMQLKEKVFCSTMGWGLTHDDNWLIMSDGGNFLYFFEPETFRLNHRLAVRDRGKPIYYLNELEFIKGEIWANIWKDNRIARINPDTGQVIAWLDMSPLVDLIGSNDQENVLNGIAWDSVGDRIFVTGKRWNKLFEISLLP